MKDTLLLTIGILVPLVTLLIFGYVSYQYTLQSVANENWVQHTALVLQKTEHLYLILKDAESAQRGYVITGNDSYLTPFTSALSEYKMDLTELRQLTSDNPVEQKNLDELEPMIKKRLDYGSYIIDLRKSQGMEAAVKISSNGTGLAIMNNIKKSIMNIEDEENSLLGIRNQESASSATFTENLLVYGTMIVGIVTTSIIILVVSNLRKRQSQIRNELDRQVKEKTMQLQQTNEIVESQKQKLIHANEELNDRDKSKGEFVAMITHDLRTPLVPIQGYADILLSGRLGELNDEQKVRLKIIKSSTETLLRMIKDLLDVQKLEMGQLKFDKKTHSLSELIKDIVLKMKETTDKHGITVLTELSDVSCFCDKERIEQVLINLILNSVDFVPEKDGTITITLDKENNHANIIIKDNGIGIDKENLDKIFVKFYQIDTSTTRERSGSGLGLSICKGIIENHNGKIWAKSDGIGKGTEFHILLPLTAI